MKRFVLALTPWFRDAFRKRRCLISADGFYEWKGAKGKKQPYHFRLRGEKVFAFAGLGDIEGELETSAQITTDANELVKEVHSRMPVILGPDHFSLWRDEEADRESLLGILRPFPADLMEGFPASTRVNRGGAEGADLIEPLRA